MSASPPLGFLLRIYIIPKFINIQVIISPFGLMEAVPPDLHES